MYYSYKRIGPISTGHRQYKAESHCRWIHGYGRYVELKFACDKRDDKGWVYDFGGLKWFKKWLEDQWDHKLLVAHDDPALLRLREMEKEDIISLNVMPEEYGPGIEDSCRFVFDYANPIILNQTEGRVWLERVRIWETEKNYAEYVWVK